MTSGRGIVNFRQRGRLMHVVHSGLDADSESAKQVLVVGGVMLKIRRDTLKEIARRRQPQDLLSVSVNAKLPERPSLEGYTVEVLPLDHVVRFFKNLSKRPE